MSWNAVSYNPPSRLFWSFQTSAALCRSLILWKVGKLSYLFHSLILAIADGKKFASPPLSQSILTLDRSLSIMVIYVNETLWLKKKLSVSPLHIRILNSNSGFRICSKCHQKEHAALRRHETLNLGANRAEKTAICNQIFWQKDFQTRQQQIRTPTYVTSKETTSEIL